MLSMLPPLGMCGAHSWASLANEWHDTVMARAKPALELSITWPCKSAKGAQAIECTTKSK